MSETIGFVGLGKLGTPVALAIESKGYQVVGYDTNPTIVEAIERNDWPYEEAEVPGLLENSNLSLALSVGEVVARSDIVFCPVQTPHEERYEGTTRLPEERVDFDYTYLKAAVKEVADEAQLQQKPTTLAVISTCLPGTFEREIRPLLNEYVDYVYTPQFIAMGTVVEDYLNPEFTLIGVDSPKAAEKLVEFYSTLFDKPTVVTDITTAEGIKVSYNTWITAKTVIANVWGELAHKLGMDFNAIYQAWAHSTNRILSPKYMQAGVGDGGGCHPRDNIALSHIAREVGLSHDIFEDLMQAREDHMQWLAHEAYDLQVETHLPIVILGRAFKPNTKIETGSPAILLSNILKEQFVPHLHLEDLDGTPQRAVYVIATAHERYAKIRFPKGSTVLDPFGIIDPQEGVRIMNLGRQNKYE